MFSAPRFMVIEVFQAIVMLFWFCTVRPFFFLFAEKTRFFYHGVNLKGTHCKNMNGRKINSPNGKHNSPAKLLCYVKHSNTGAMCGQLEIKANRLCNLTASLLT